MLHIEAEEELVAVGTTRSQLAVQVSGMGITGRLTISSTQGYRTNEIHERHTKDKRCELASILQWSPLDQSLLTSVSAAQGGPSAPTRQRGS